MSLWPPRREDQAKLDVRSGASPKGRSGRQTKSGASGSELLLAGKHVPDRVGKSAREVDLGDLGTALLSEPALEIGEIERFSSPEKLTGYTGLCPRVNQSGEKDRRGPLSKHGPTYLRWALLEATMHALKHPAYSERYQRNKKRLGKQRGAKVAQVDIARRLSHAIWHMLSRKEKFAPRGAAFRLAA
jgi:hypothetical protein